LSKETVLGSFKDAIKNGMTEYLDELKQKIYGLTDAELRWQANLDANSIQWLVWHMARVEDSWINNNIAGGESVWDAGGWAAKTGITYDNSGYGQSSDDVRAMPDVSMPDLVQYYEDVRSAAFKVIDGTNDEDMDNVFTRGGRSVTWSWILGHVLVEESQHLGQVAFARGLIRGLNN
jgi:uncharacterized damage-inducible protein DinB